MNKIVIDGNAVYEIDEACMRRKKEKEENKNKQNKNEQKNNNHTNKTRK